MPGLATTLLWLVCAPLCAALLWFTLETLGGLRRSLGPVLPARQDDCAVIIPAHDEAIGLGAMLGALPPAVRERVLLVADNCSDETAAIARAAGVRVIERSEPARRGKGFALALARDHLAAAPPAAIMVLDADCRIARGDPFALAGRAAAEGVAIQTENLQRAGPGRSVMVQIGAFAFLIKNLVRARGLERLGGGTILQGTGMVLPWPLFARLDLATGSAVEDMDLTVELARAGVSARLDARCRIESAAGHSAAHLAQRQRWEHGFIRNGLRRGLPLVFGGSRLRFAIGCHMLVPPLALLFLLACAAIAGGALLAWGANASMTPVVTLTTLAGLAGVVVLLAWVREGRATLPLRSLLLAPAYVLWKLPMYLALPLRRRVAWTRTERVSDADSNGDS